MSDINDFFDELNRGREKHVKKEAKRLEISKDCAENVVYLRDRSRWSQRLEDELIRMDKAGEPAPNIMEYGHGP